MATFAELRRFGLALPGVVEHAHMGQPSLRTGGKMFVLWSEQSKITIMKLDRAHQDMVFEVSPEIFSPCKVGTGMWSYVVIKKLTAAQLKMLVTEAWSQVAPKKMRDAFTSNLEALPPLRRPRKPAVRKDTRPPLSSRARKRRQ